MGSSLEQAVEQCHAALGDLVRGNAGAWEAVLSHVEAPTLGNPFGPFVRGLDDVMATARDAATRYGDGELVAFDRVATYEASELACVVEVERFRARVGGSPDVADVSLRVTSVFRLEDDGWKLVHRHADPITTAQASSSVVRN